jgi:NADH:ubiquinone oxidoreductase subunit 6 (subunit J)
MEVLLLLLFPLLIGVLLITRDNIYASLLLSALGVAVAFGTYIHLGELAFILTALVYIVASLTLVVVAAATLKESAATMQWRWAAAGGLLILAAAALTAQTAVEPPLKQTVDFALIPLISALFIFALKMAFEITL